MTKMTKRDYFNSLLSLSEVQADEALVSFINHELELLSEKKPTATQIANDSLKVAITNYLSEGGKHTISEMLAEVPALEGMQNQKVSALVRQMIADGVVQRIEEKRKAYFALMDAEGV